MQRALHAVLGGSLDLEEMVAQGCGNCLTLLSGVDGGRASLSRARIRSLGGAPWLFPARAAVVFRDSDIGMTDDDAAGTSIGLFQGSDLSFEASCIDGPALLDARSTASPSTA